MIKERWVEHKLVDRPKVLYEYYVTGDGQFPFDMLRYDSAWPADSESAYKTGLSFHEAYAGRRSIKLRSYRHPTVARWSSFSWSVGVENLESGSWTT